MSFNRASNLESQPTGFRREDDPQFSDDPEYRDFTVKLSEKLFGLTANITQLSRQSALLGTNRETERVRERVQDLIEETGTGFKEVGDGLKRVAAWPDLSPQQRWTQEKISRDFKSSLEEFQTLQRTVIQKQKDTRNAEIARQQEGEAGEGGQSQQQLQQQQQEQMRLADQGEVDFQEQLIVEREAEIRNIEQSVNELNELFVDVATIIAEQGNTVDTISANIENTRDDTFNAEREIRQANKYQKSARSKACCLLLILAIVIIVIVLAVLVG